MKMVSMWAAGKSASEFFEQSQNVIIRLRRFDFEQIAIQLRSYPYVQAPPDLF